ncbi:MAG: BlaI/MecI/CopY family transcriptional regulator [Pseudomonadales bacterium]|nr:BlaI/MecI/CopY family transcriptional regulator [Pseudomonadales bacterium]
MERLTAKERQIMDILYAQPSISVSDVQDRLPEGSSYSSVRASLSRLVDKGYLQTARDGARHLYLPVDDPSTASKQALQRVMQTFFQGSPKATISAVLQFSDTDISEVELKEIQRMLDEGGQDG